MKNERSILTGQLLDFKQTKLQVIYSFTSITMWNDYLQQISVLEKELETFQSVSDELLAKEKIRLKEMVQAVEVQKSLEVEEIENRYKSQVLN